MIKTGTFKGSGNKWLLFTGLILGLVSAALVFVYLRSAGDEAGGGSVSSGPTTPVLVAAQDIAPGTRITTEMLTVKSVATTDVLIGAFSDTEDLVGQLTVVPVIAGEQVLSDKVAASGTEFASLGANPPASLVVPEGQRAVSATVSNAAAAGGLARPGDYVDIILAVQVDELDAAGESIGSNTIATTLMQNVQLLALDQDVTTANVGDVTGSGGEGSGEVITGNSPTDEVISPGATTATFVVSPVHAEVLGLANLCADHYNGSLIISLRSFGDDAPVPGRDTYASDGAPPDCATLLSLEALP